MEYKNFYAIIYVKENVLRSRFISEDEYKNRYDNESRGYFLIQTEILELPVELPDFSCVEQAIQQLETLVKIIYRRYFLSARYLNLEQNLLLFVTKEVENDYAERQKQYPEQGI